MHEPLFDITLKHNSDQDWPAVQMVPILGSPKIIEETSGMGVWWMEALYTIFTYCRGTYKEAIRVNLANRSPSTPESVVSIMLYPIQIIRVYLGIVPGCNDELQHLEAHNHILWLQYIGFVNIYNIWIGMATRGSSINGYNQKNSSIKSHLTHLNSINI